MMLHEEKPSLDDAIEHFGVKGMKWGVRRDHTGRRPVAVALNRSKFGRLANANAERYMEKQRRTGKTLVAPPVTNGAVRRGAKKVATKMTDRQIRLHEKARDGKGVIGALAKADKHTWGGNGRFENYHNKKISQLERSKERIDKGEIVARTLLFGPRYSKVKKN